MGRLISRYGNSVRQFVRFGLVGGAGVVVNLLVVVILKRELSQVWPSAAYDGIWWSIPFSEFNVRWYHVMSTVAFLVANIFNFQLNRWWTFNSRRAAPWFREYGPFLTVGLVAQGIGLILLTLMLHPDSPLTLPRDVLDDSTGLRTRLYWAQLIMVLLTVPISFLLNKFWTFRAVRRVRVEEAQPVVEPELPGEQG